MANVLFDPGRSAFLSGDADWDGPAVMRAALLRGYTFNAAHQYVSQVTGAGGVLVSSVVLTGRTTTAGVADAADVIFPSVPAGAPIPAVILYQSSAFAGGADVAPTAQRLIGFIDSATGLPVTPTGTDVAIVWDNGPNRIFRL